jgi:FkbM family methyltransferase
MGSQIFFRGAYSGGQLKILRRLLDQDSVFVDAGANQGEFTVCAASVIAEGAVHAFEPVPNVRQRLERNVEANGFSNVVIQSVGLSDASANEVPIYGADSTFSDGTQNIGLPTLFRMSGRSEALGLIDLRRLDDVLPDHQRVNVIKIDVEGAEWAVLRGAEATIARERPAIIFEANEETCEAAGYSMSDVFEWMRARGYDLRVIDAAGCLHSLNGEPRFCNILGLPKERRDLFKRTGTV